LALTRDLNLEQGLGGLFKLRSKVDNEYAMTSVHIQSPEQTKHDRINLVRLSRRLQWAFNADSSHNQQDAVLAAQIRAFQNVRSLALLARRMLMLLTDSEACTSTPR
jgi:hypothetical protein